MRIRTRSNHAVRELRMGCALDLVPLGGEGSTVAVNHNYHKVGDLHAGEAVHNERLIAIKFGDRPTMTPARGPHSDRYRNALLVGDAPQ